MRKNVLFLLLFLGSLFPAGCTNVSLQMKPSPEGLKQCTMPVKFKTPVFEWNTSNGLPHWFTKQQISSFIGKLKERAPELFSDNEKAFSLTFFFEHARVKDANGAHAFLSVFTLFAIPWWITHTESFKVTVKIDDGKYIAQNSFVINEKTYLWLIPFFAYLLPVQENSFCRGISIKDEAINSAAFQNAFLNMIYSLDKDKLRKMYDERYGEPVQLLEEFSEQNEALLQ